MFDRSVHAMESLLASDMNMLAHNWDCFYKGIYRVNTLLAMLEEVPDFKDEVESDQIKGEALFMRAFFLAQLSALHGEIPLPLNSDDVSLPAASIDQVYAQIAADLQDAISLLPSENYVNTKNGRATKWAAQALMARVFLFYTGFYEADQIPSGYSGRYEATKGFFPIPQTAIDKSEGLLQQVPGWETADVIYEEYPF